MAKIWIEVMNMKNKKELPKLGKKGTVAGLVLSFVAMITLVGAYTFSQYQDNVENELAELELMEEQGPSVDESLLDAEEANGDQILNDDPTLDTSDETSGTIAESVDDNTETSATEIANEEATDITTTNESIASQATFSEDTTLMWPVNGGILMMFNMDTAIYFETLDQYKLNPAMIIEGEIGTEVLSAERGTVESITIEADTGNTITIDMGNGYSAVYGQLDDLKVSVGSYVEKGQVIGSLTEPTKYYSLEGCNLYFQMLKDGEPVDPLNYLVE